MDTLVALGPDGLRQREDARDEEQRARGVTFSVAGEASTRLFPFDLVPRVVAADDWAPAGRARASGPARWTHSCATSTASAR